MYSCTVSCICVNIDVKYCPTVIYIFMYSCTVSCICVNVKCAPLYCILIYCLQNN